jgi:hypothetical protein
MVWYMTTVDIVTTAFCISDVYKDVSETNVMFLDIIHRPVFILKQHFSTWICHRLQVKSQLDPIDRASL